MENPIKQIVKFNEDAKLIEKGYVPWLEAAFQIEEALEGFNIQALADNLGIKVEADQKLDAKAVSRVIAGTAAKDTTISEVDALDKACDAVVFAVGSMAKLGLSVNQITLALNTVMAANNAKLKAVQYDSAGKLCKPTDFVGPEAKLQEILNTRKSRIEGV